mgnify:FL=1
MTAKTNKKTFPKVRNTAIIVVLVLVCFFLGSYSFKCLSEKICEVDLINHFIRHDTLITAPRGVIHAEVADTKSTKELGLSGRKEMGKDEGLLFVFDDSGRYGFWMKDMMFPLDIIWLNQNGLVVEIERNLSPDTYPKAYINKTPASYVLEINAGRSEELGLFIGSKVKISK